MAERGPAGLEPHHLHGQNSPAQQCDKPPDGSHESLGSLVSGHRPSHALGEAHRQRRLLQQIRENVRRVFAFMLDDRGRVDALLLPLRVFDDLEILNRDALGAGKTLGGPGGIVFLVERRSGRRADDALGGRWLGLRHCRGGQNQAARRTGRADALRRQARLRQQRFHLAAQALQRGPDAAGGYFFGADLEEQITHSGST